MTKFENIDNGENILRVAIEGEGPVILCVHGWPELWYSWRHQLKYFSKRGYRVAAMDVRGYGGSSKPHAISAYTLRELASDVVAVARSLSSEPVILFGHDWGAPIVYYTALLHSDAIRAVAGLSVPYLPRGDVLSLDFFEMIFKDKFFYQLYFQEEGPVEAEIEADVADGLRKIYFGIPEDVEAFANKPRDAKLLDGLRAPEKLPAWMSETEFQVYVDAFEAGGMRGPINRYRAQTQDFDELVDFRGKHLLQPACFIGGANDGVRRFVPGVDLFKRAGDACEDFRGTTIIDGVGHWVQQEAVAQTNAAMEAFLKDL